MNGLVKEIKDTKKSEIRGKSLNPWSSPILMVKKKTEPGKPPINYALNLNVSMGFL